MSTPAAENLPYGAALREHVLDSFADRMRPVAVSLVYRLGLLVVAVTMVLLPLVYVGLIAAAGYGVYYHAVHNLSIFENVEPAKVAFLAYAGPLFIGVVLVFFMIKPLFARPPRREEPRSLARDDEPLLFAYIERLCALVGAPFPKRIDVDCQVNASASFRRGWLSLLSQDLVLTLGLPLVDGLSLQQLTGVLAHEFGHFAQGAGMRLTYVIRSVNHWFMRVVYERDSWDEHLAEAARSGGHLFISLMVWGAQAMVWVTRRILWLLMNIGHAISCFMLRQMEFDADRYEARMVGSETFESTCRELSNLNVAFQKTLSDLGSSWEEGRLVDNLPGMVTVNRRDFDADLVGRIQEQVDDSSTGLFDTHPADRDRMASAVREGTDAVFRSTLPATALFHDFDELAATVSLDFYGANLGEAVTPESLRDLEEIQGRQAAAEEEGRSFGRFFQGIIHPLRPLDLAGAGSGAELDRESLRAEIEDARHVLRETSAAHRSQLPLYEEAQSDLVTALQAESLIEAGVSISPREFGLADSDLSTAMDKRAEARRRLKRLDGALGELEAAAARRLDRALDVFEAPELVDEAEAGQRRGELSELRAAATAIRAEATRLDALRIDYLILGAVVGALQENNENAKLVERFQRLAEQLHENLMKLRESWKPVPYPFDHTDASMTLGQFIVPDTPDINDVGSLYNLTQETLNRGFGVYHRVLGRLGRGAEEAEETLGLEPLPEPPEEES